MKLLIIRDFYLSYIEYFYKNRDIESKSYNEQMLHFQHDEFSWFGAWKRALSPFNYEVRELIINAAPMQLAWAKENGVNTQSLPNIALEQVKEFKPDILWYDCFNKELLRQIKTEVSSVKLVLGWVGSAIAKSSIWKQLDLVLTCAPESVDIFKNNGLKAEHLNHAFDIAVDEKLINSNKKEMDLSFIGQIIRGKEFHLERERILESLSKDLKVNVYSPSNKYCMKDNIKTFTKILAYDFVNAMKSIGVSREFIAKIPKGEKALNWDSRPLYPINKNLKPFIKEPVFGMEMFRIIKESNISLNIHADSSPKYASNMRLFEITGVGTCMVVDYKNNIKELFEPDYEVVTYKNSEECIEKINWLMEHPSEREKIALAGKRRTLKEHTFEKRAEQLDKIIKKQFK